MKHNKALSNITSSALPAVTYFVTGTDTDVGKTICSKALLQAANQQGLRTLAYKPIAAGCAETLTGLRNEDALILQQVSSIKVDYEMVNPIAFKAAIAPHIAADMHDKVIDLDIIDQGLMALQQQKPQFLLVEGAGGWHLPINQRALFSHWVVQQKMPVILVVGIKLGCLNHALLTVESIQNSGLPIAGWIANHLTADMPCAKENITTLKQFINGPLLGEVPYLNNINEQDLSPYINVCFSPSVR